MYSDGASARPAHAARFGGDPDRIYLVGHSAGATHIASYVFDRSLQPPSGPASAARS